MSSGGSSTTTTRTRTTRTGTPPSGDHDQELVAATHRVVQDEKTKDLMRSETNHDGGSANRKTASPAIELINTRTADQPSSSNGKKKRSPNWLPQEEEQLASSWLKASERADFTTNQTSESFYKAVELDFNRHSKLHYRDYDQIRIRWAALNTSTLKFSAIYNAIEKSPPPNTTPYDWMIGARKIYLEQTKGHAFKDELAWQKLRYAPKWQQDNKKLNIHQYVLTSDLNLPDLPAQPSVRAADQHPPLADSPSQIIHHILQQQPQTRADRPPGGSSTSSLEHSPGSNRSIAGDIEGDRSSKRFKFDPELKFLFSQTEQDHHQDRATSIPVITSGRPIDSSRHDSTVEAPEQEVSQPSRVHHFTLPQPYHPVSQELDPSVNRLARENLELDRDLKRSQIEMNDLKLVMQSEAECPDPESITLLRLMKSRLKKRLLAEQ